MIDWIMDDHGSLVHKPGFSYSVDPSGAVVLRAPRFKPALEVFGDGQWRHLLVLENLPARDPCHGARVPAMPSLDRQIVVFVGVPQICGIRPSQLSSG